MICHVPHGDQLPYKAQRAKASYCYRQMETKALTLALTTTLIVLAFASLEY